MVAVFVGLPPRGGFNELLGRKAGDYVKMLADELRPVLHERYRLAESGASILIQGAGTVGGNLARMLHSDGHKVCGFSDLNVGLFNERGLDIPALIQWRNEHGTLEGAPGDYEAVPNTEMLLRPCDVLIPCAVANAVHSRNARDLEAKIVIEGAHGPVSARADRILHDQGVPVVPDILANAGGVVADYFEWVQNRQGLSWLEVVLQNRLTRFMTEAWDAVSEVQLRYGVRMRMAANMLAVERVTAADQLRGSYA